MSCHLSPVAVTTYFGSLNLNEIGYGSPPTRRESRELLPAGFREESGLVVVCLVITISPDLINFSLLLLLCVTGISNGTFSSSWFVIENVVIVRGVKHSNVAFHHSLCELYGDFWILWKYWLELTVLAICYWMKVYF